MSEHAPKHSLNLVLEGQTIPTYHLMPLISCIQEMQQDPTPPLAITVFSHVETLISFPLWTPPVKTIYTDGNVLGIIKRLGFDRIDFATHPTYVAWLSEASTDGLTPTRYLATEMKIKDLRTKNTDEGVVFQSSPHNHTYRRR